jgi:hypothetical protein
MSDDTSYRITFSQNIILSFHVILNVKKISSSLYDVQFIPSQRHKMLYHLQMVDTFMLLVSTPEMSVKW